MQTKATFYLVLADGSVDQIAEGKRNADREARDLRSMGFTVTLLGPTTGAKADDISEGLEAGRISVRKARELLKTEAE